MNDQRKRFADLVFLHLDDVIDDGQMAELNAMLAENAEFRDLFVRLCIQDGLMAEKMSPARSRDAVGGDSTFEVDANLLLEAFDEDQRAKAERKAAAMLEKQQSDDREAERVASMRRLAGLSETEDGSKTRHYVIPKPLFYGSISAVIAVLAAIIWPMLETAPEKIDQGLIGPQYFEVATLVEQIEAKWERSRHRIALGQPIFNEKITLKEGFAKLRFKDEAEVILEGPCTIEPVSESEVRIHSGKLVGACRTQQSKGFIVRANNAKIVDLGTEFGVGLDEDGSSFIQVYDGEVNISGPSANGSASSVRELKVNDAVSVNQSATRIIDTDMDELAFVREEEFIANAKADESPYHRWLAYSYKLRRDPDLVAYYAFDPDQEGSGRMDNLASGPIQATDGMIEGTHSVIGRFPQYKKSLRYDSDDDTVRLTMPGTTKQLTFIIWMRIHTLEEKFHTALFNTEQWRRGEVNSRLHIQVTNDGKSKHGDSKGWGVSQPLIESSKIGPWIQYVIVIDRSKGIAREYIDGRFVYESSFAASMIPFELDRCEIGNWKDVNDSDVGSENLFRSLRGDVDEVAVLYRAFTQEEVRENYEAGAPPQ